MRVTLLLTEGPEAGKSFHFNQADTFLVGRTPKAHLRFKREADRHISRTHFLLDVRPPRIFITDLGSTNGTFVNSKRIQQTDLKDGDVIRIGKTKILVTIEADEKELRPEVICKQCNRNVTEEVGHVPPDKLVDLVYICRDCQAKARRAAKEAKAKRTALVRPAAIYLCVNCGRDLTATANADSLAAQLTNSLYLCPKCTGAGFDPGFGVTDIGNFTLLGVIGEGGMGIVYKAIHRSSRRICALKMILPELITSDYASMVFEREIEVQSKVIHPNLVRIIEHGRYNDRPYFVSEYLAGGDVKNLVAWEFQGPVPPELACRITIHILRGLQALHNNGFIHRDLKPANFLLDRPYTDDDFTVKIADYGLAKSFENAGNSIFDYTREGVAAGSYVFIPPEQITNYKYVKPPVDVYAVGASLYFMLCARHSVDFPDMSDQESDSAPTSFRHPIQIVLEDPPVPILERNVDLPASLAAVVDKSVDKDVAGRFQSADEFRVELERVAIREAWLIT